jgi:hypothetical protein
MHHATLFSTYLLRARSFRASLAPRSSSSGPSWRPVCARRINRGPGHRVGTCSSAPASWRAALNIAASSCTRVQLLNLCLSAHFCSDCSELISTCVTGLKITPLKEKGRNVLHVCGKCVNWLKLLGAAVLNHFQSLYRGPRGERSHWRAVLKNKAR